MDLAVQISVSILVGAASQLGGWMSEERRKCPCWQALHARDSVFLKRKSAGWMIVRTGRLFDGAGQGSLNIFVLGPHKLLHNSSTAEHNSLSKVKECHNMNVVQ